MTHFDANLIDRIVRDVLNRLRDGDRGVSKGASSNAPLLLDVPVLTEDSLDAQTNGHAAIVIGRKTVLTPTARDFLRKRAITVTRLGDAPPSSTKPTGNRLAILATDSETVTSAVTAVGWNHSTNDCWKRATRDAVAALAKGVGGVVVFTNQDAAVGCVANRNTNVRAAIVDDAHGVRAAREMIGPNLLVVDPIGKTFVDLRGILKEFAAGTTEPPHDWVD